MTPETRPASASSPARFDPTPVAFGGLFGWLHPAAGRRGVVLCGAYGFEQMAAHRPWRALAGQLAEAGCPTLRFDYPGEGDSTDPDAPTVAACVAAIRQAVRFLRETAGVDEIVLVGLRLGASLATLAAEAEPVDRLVLLAPVITGRAYLREMRLRAQTIGRLPDGSAPPAEAECLTVGGFRMEAPFQAELSALNLTRIATPPAPRVLLLSSETGSLAGRLEACGCVVETGPFAGLAHLVGDPIFVKVPEADFARIIAFAAEGLVPVEAASTAPVPLSAHLAGPGWSEGAIRLASGLSGTRCAPHRPDAAAPTILFVSTGMTVRSGWGRQTTRLARTLAAEGIASVRFDVAGVGDSVDRPDGRWPLFAPDGFTDVMRAVDSIAGAGPIVLVGGCSGAYAAFQALCRDPRIDGALLVNLYCFDWDPEQNVHDVIRQTYGSAATYAALLKQGDTWRRLIRGQIRVRAIGSVLARRGLDTALRRIRRAFRPPNPGGSVARRVAAIRRRGAAIRLLYSAGDPGLAALRRHLGRNPDQVARRLGAPVTIVPAADHNLGSVEAQAALGQAVRDLLCATRRTSVVPAKRPAPTMSGWLQAVTGRA
ncbi:alpha/beta fold hydrolase [Methylobacterium sp. E-005]|uniref:alpha/beta fold hydrolase n=1 Tax=Methylobacterium sp. E-005 TaxID=2836549 RepID=UPI001FBA375A|nr:alpha/beta fold hydrolase [Methylobacterium sp. E-005]MCJ2090891.1 alpha/beta fold hydrolase [Methylobacterium sp. E-005]